ncbi:hypothetical protein CSC28_4351 [Pseudomonas paraeruginosa]|nr:hypothetical protein CSC28_4351 [Pseudomonas paraeruginosa]
MTAMLTPSVEGAAFYRPRRVRAEVFATAPAPLIVRATVQAETS